MNVYFFFVEERYIFDLLMINGWIRYKLLDIFGKKDKKIIDYLIRFD